MLWGLRIRPASTFAHVAHSPCWSAEETRRQRNRPSVRTRTFPRRGIQQRERTLSIQSEGKGEGDLRSPFQGGGCLEKATSSAGITRRSFPDAMDASLAPCAAPLYVFALAFGAKEAEEGEARLGVTVTPSMPSSVFKVVFTGIRLYIGKVGCRIILVYFQRIFLA